jgi:hypothetical protein
MAIAISCVLLKFFGIRRCSEHGDGVEGNGGPGHIRSVGHF